MHYNVSDTVLSIFQNTEMTYSKLRYNHCIALLTRYLF